jgi:hypothetical protein
VENYSNLIALWKQNLAEEQIDPDLLGQSMIEIIVFGSRAAGVSGEHSDLDVLCIGNMKARRRTRKLDLICMQRNEYSSSGWLGSELGFHVANYGLWLKGEPSWISSAFASPGAISRKRERIVRLTSNVVNSWEKLHPVFRQRFPVTLRRELQRLHFLLNNVPVPPTPLLDRDWSSGIVDSEMLIDSADMIRGTYHLRNLIKEGCPVQNKR